MNSGSSGSVLFVGGSIQSVSRVVSISSFRLSSGLSVSSFSSFLEQAGDNCQVE